MPLPGLKGVLAVKRQPVGAFVGNVKKYNSADSNTTAEFTVGNVNLGADDPRRLVVVIGGCGRQGDISANNYPIIKVGGITLTRDSRSGDDGASNAQQVRGFVWSGVVPTGDLSPVTARFPSSIWKTLALSVFVLRNTEFLTCQGQWGIYGNSGSDHAATAALSATEKQFYFISGCAGGASNAMTFSTGLTEVLDESDGESQRLGAAWAGLGNPRSNATVTWGTTSNVSLSAARYQ